MNNRKVHLLYISIIICLVVALCITNIPNLLRWYYYSDGITYMKIGQDVDILNPDNGKVVGKLYSGAVVQGPLIEDLDDTDLGDNDRWKILFDANMLKRENREYYDSDETNELKLPFRYELNNTDRDRTLHH